LNIHDDSEVPCQLAEELAAKLAKTFSGQLWDNLSEREKNGIGYSR
jgi:hypothetical protein